MTEVNVRMEDGVLVIDGIYNLYIQMEKAQPIKIGKKNWFAEAETKDGVWGTFGDHLYLHGKIGRVSFSEGRGIDDSGEVEWSDLDFMLGEETLNNFGVRSFMDDSGSHKIQIFHSSLYDVNVDGAESVELILVDGLMSDDEKVSALKLNQ